jgi:hypothetical protein
VITFETVQCATYAPSGEIEYTEEGIESHTIDLNKETIALKCDDCEVSGEPENITDVIRYEKKGMLRLSFAKKEYTFYVYAKKVNGVYNVQKMIVYENGLIRYDYFVKK